MKKLSSGLLTVAAALLFSSCGNDRSSTSDSTNSTVMTADSSTMNSMNSDTMSNMSGTADMTTPNGFAMHAASGSMMEIQLAQTAQQKASSKEVKDFAKMIEQDHTNASNELKSMATGKSITLPTTAMPDHQSHMTSLNNMTGADFDRAYMSMMVDAHQKDVDMFKQASQSMTDNEMKAFATKTLPVLQKHLDRAKALQTKLGGTTGTTGTGTGTTGSGTGTTGSGTGTGTTGSGTNNP